MKEMKNEDLVHTHGVCLQIIKKEMVTKDKSYQDHVLISDQDLDLKTRKMSIEGRTQLIPEESSN